MTLGCGAVVFAATLLVQFRLDREMAIGTNAPVAPAGRVDAAAAPVNNAPRPVYRHSVVPGGVRSPQEVAQAMARDTVVAAHYAGVKTAAIRAVQLSAPLKVHVSYRVGDHVYWTRRPLTLAAGESVLTDGSMTIRARCGNLLSVQPLGPALDDEPAPPEFDLIVLPYQPSQHAVMGDPPALPAPHLNPTSPGSGPPVGARSDPPVALIGKDPPVGPRPDPPVPLIGHGPPGRPRPDPPVPLIRTDPPPDPPLPVPEPGTSVLVGIGLAGAGAWRYFRKKNKSESRSSALK